MSETPDTPTVRSSTATATAPAAAEALYRTPRVFLAAAWVAIVAGIVFIISVIFFTGMALGHHGGHHHHHKHHAAWMHPHRMGPGGPGGPGAGAPGGPGGQGGQQGPNGGASPTPSTPSPVRPSSMGPGQIPSSVFHSAALAPHAVGQAPAVIVLAG